MNLHFSSLNKELKKKQQQPNSMAHKWKLE